MNGPDVTPQTTLEARGQRDWHNGRAVRFGFRAFALGLLAQIACIFAVRAPAEAPSVRIALGIVMIAAALVALYNIAMTVYHLRRRPGQ